MAQNPVFTITMRNGRVMKGELYPETAPQSVGNFVALAKRFYECNGFTLQKLDDLMPYGVANG